MKRKKKHGHKRKKQNLYWREKAPVIEKKKLKLPDKKIMKWAGIALAAVVAIVLCCIFLPKALHKDAVDMKEYIQISVSGKNGEGVISFSEDPQYLARIMGYSPETAEGFYTEKIIARMDYMSNYQIDFSKYDGLSNNDVIDVKIIFPGNAASKAKFKPINTEFSYIVQGLEE